jgi:NADH:ubiquinone oxidoreductase subunit 3 (subunit A)
MSDFLRSYLTVAILGGAALVLVGAMLGIGSIIRPRRPQPQKYIPYESGVDPVVDWVNEAVPSIVATVK